jgi:hypothetical protein
MAVAVDQFRGVIDRGFCRHVQPGMCAVATTSSCRELLATGTSRQADRGQPGTVAVTLMVADTLLAPQTIASANPRDEYQPASSTTRTRSGTYPADWRTTTANAHIATGLPGRVGDNRTIAAAILHEAN